MEIGKVADFLIETGEKLEGMGWILLAMGIFLVIYKKNKLHMVVIFLCFFAGRPWKVYGENGNISLQPLNDTGFYVKDSITAKIKAEYETEVIYRICLKCNGKVFLDEILENDQPVSSWEKIITLPVEEGENIINGEMISGTGKKTEITKQWIGDITAPVMWIEQEGSCENGYYKETGKVKVCVKERNFSPELWKVTKEKDGAGEYKQWENVNGIWICQIPYEEDGEYTVSVSGRDPSGNTGTGKNGEIVERYSWIVDKTPPGVQVDGVQNEGQYNGEVFLSVWCTDPYLNVEKTDIFLEKEDSGRIEGNRQIQDREIKVTWDHLEEYGDGRYHLMAACYDQAGNPFVQDEKFLINQTGSVYEIISGENPVEIQETNLSRLKKWKILCSRDGEVAELEETKDVVCENRESDFNEYIYTIKEEVFSREGEYVLYFLSEDEAGNENSSRNMLPNLCVKTKQPEMMVKKRKKGPGITGKVEKMLEDPLRVESLIFPGILCCKTWKNKRKKLVS